MCHINFLPKKFDENLILNKVRCNSHFKINRTLKNKVRETVNIRRVKFKLPNKINKRENNCTECVTKSTVCNIY